MTVRSPSQYDGAVLEGYVSSVNRGGRITGRSEMTLNFDRIRLRDGRSYKFAGTVEGVLASNGESVRVDNEGAVAEGNNRTNTTVKRGAIGATVGAGAGAGSVYVQGRDDLELMSGTQITVRASAPYNSFR